MLNCLGISLLSGIDIDCQSLQYTWWMVVVDIDVFFVDSGKKPLLFHGMTLVS